MLDKPCAEYSELSKKQAGGFILDSGELIKCENIHESPMDNFLFNSSAFEDAQKKGKVIAFFHSSKNPFMTHHDRQQQISTGLECRIVCAGGALHYRNVPPLLGRVFDFGKMDCYALVRDAFHLCGVDFPDVEREPEWWLKGKNYFIDGLPVHGFTEISLGRIKPGDVIITKPFKNGAPCHAMIYLGGEMLLQHDAAGRFSRRIPYRLAHVKQTHSVWRYKDPVDLRGIYEDMALK